MQWIKKVLIALKFEKETYIDNRIGFQQNKLE